jgi:hypothetical protein
MKTDLKQSAEYEVQIIERFADKIINVEGFVYEIMLNADILHQKSNGVLQR